MSRSVATSTFIAALCLSASTAALAQSEPGSGGTAPTAVAPGDEVIVTGTRATGITAAESATPIKLLGAEAIAHVGQPNLNQVLTQLVPSFTAQALGGDTANLTLSARLRGLSPNHTLVMVNGKRRHGTANLAVLGGPYQGGAAPDLDLISPSSIKRIEVLEDGAAAQYGSDAIAGVINIILKDDAEGVSGYGTYGKYYDTGGETYAGTVHMATRLGDRGFTNITILHRSVDFTQVGGIDVRVTDRNGQLYDSYGTPPALSTATRNLYAAIPGFPFVNKINGNARSKLTNAQYNTGYDLTDEVKLYSFGTYSRRIASARQNFRVPDRIIAGATPGDYTATLITPGARVFAPQGFNPREKIREDDYGITGGVKTQVAGFALDLSSTYGSDKNQVYTIDSGNRSLFIDTLVSPTGFFDGTFKNVEWTSNLDLSRELEIGMAAPMNLAFGAEYRWNKYSIGAGDELSYYKEGGQSFPGFRPSDAGTHKRDNISLYADAAFTPVEGLKADGAVRYERYSDFGSQWIFKGTSRYDLNEAAAVRGTVSTGFRAPTLAESFYSATNVGPTTAFVQLPANSAAAKLLGFQDLEPEKSLNFSAGTVLRPARSLTLTVDAYQVRIRNRILGTGSIYGTGGSPAFPNVTQAIIANGNILDPTVTFTGITTFTNGARTRTRGIDLTASYTTDFDAYGRVNWTLSGNLNRTKVLNASLAPRQLTPAGASQPIALFDRTTISNLEDASPRAKLVAGAFYTLDRLSATARGTVFGKTSQMVSGDGTNFYNQRIGTAFIADLEVNYRLTDQFELSIGANNLFNKKPPTIQLLADGSPADGGLVYDAPLGFSPYGINGGYYYTRINFTF